VPGNQPAAGGDDQGQETAAKGKAPATGKKPMTLYAGIGVAVVAVAGVGIAMVSMSSGSKSPSSVSPAQIVAKPRKAPAPVKPAPAKKPEGDQVAEALKPKTEDAETQPKRRGRNKAADEPDSKPTSQKPPEPPSTEQAPSARTLAEDSSELNARQLYDQLLKSTAFVEILFDSGTGGVTGSASLIDRKNKLLLTNQHVTAAAAQGKVYVIFPMYEKGQLVVEKDAYSKAIRSHGDMVIPGYVEYQDSKVDLALIRLAGLPDNVIPIHLAKDSASPGQMMYSLGSPGKAPALWILSTGQARSYPHHMKWTTATDKDAKDTTDREAIMIETQSPVNHGDSGGPVVNDRGELIAVTQGGMQEANLLNIFIDVQEVKRFLSAYYKSKHLPQPDEAAPTMQVARDLPSLRNALHDRSPGKRTWACDQLATMGAEAKNAEPELIELLLDKDDNVRIKAMKALSEIGNVSQSDLQKVIEATKDSRLADLRLQGILVIRHMGEEADSAVPALIERLKDDSGDVRLEAAKTLGNLGPLAKSAVPALAEALQRRDKRHDVRQEVALAIGSIHADDPVGASALEAGLRDPIREVRLSSLQGLEKLGPEGKTTVPQVLKALKEKDREMRGQAVVTLGAIGPDAKEAVGQLAQIVVDDKELRVPAGQALGKIRKPAIGVLIKLLTVPNPPVRRVAIEALGEMGPEAGPLAARALSILNQRETDRTNRELIREAVKKIIER
jgi:HEAT repeat protein/V8-like Glu-specific endopeptidase